MKTISINEAINIIIENNREDLKNIIGEGKEVIGLDLTNAELIVKSKQYAFWKYGEHIILEEFPTAFANMHFFYLCDAVDYYYASEIGFTYDSSEKLLVG